MDTIRACYEPPSRIARSVGPHRSKPNTSSLTGQLALLAAIVAPSSISGVIVVARYDWSGRLSLLLVALGLLVAYVFLLAVALRAGLAILRASPNVGCAPMHRTLLAGCVVLSALLAVAAIPMRGWSERGQGAELWASTTWLTQSWLTQSVFFGSFALVALPVGLAVGLGMLVRGATSLRAERTLIDRLIGDFEDERADRVWEGQADGNCWISARRTVAADVHVRARQMPDERARALQTIDWREIVGRRSLADDDLDVGCRAIRDAVRRGEPFRNIVIKVSDSTCEADERWWLVSGRPIFDRAGSNTGYRGVGSDVTATRRAELRVLHLARHDSLTGLRNRSAFGETLQSLLARGDQSSCLLFIDLDGFNTVNDTHGHVVGDQLLCAVARRLSTFAEDPAFVARIGGDEFALICRDMDATEPEELARRVIASIAEPFVLDEIHVRIGVSLGLAHAPTDGRTADELFKAADLALHDAQARGGSLFVRCDAAIQARARMRAALMLDLRAALAAREFHVVFQPIVELATGRTNACEALLRWSHPEHGNVSPAVFIPLAEQIGIIGEIGAWVIETACAEAARWPDTVSVAINVSPLQFQNPDFIDFLRDVAAQTGIGLTRIELEVTESTLLEANPTTLASLRSLRALGVRVALDDFGTGYASLSYLQSFPFDRLKIDRSFIAAMDNDETQAIIRTMTDLATTLNMVTIAEGVETVDQHEKLKALGCTCAQGFLFSPPIHPDWIVARFKSDNLFVPNVAA